MQPCARSRQLDVSARTWISVAFFACGLLLADCSQSPEERLYAEAVRQEGSGAIFDARAKYVEITQRYPASNEARLALDRISAIDARRAGYNQDFQALETQELLRKQLEAQRVHTMEQEERELLHRPP